MQRNEKSVEHYIKENEVLRKELSALKKELNFNTSKFYNLFDRSLAGIFRAKQDGSVIDANNAFAQIFGFDTADDLLGDRKHQPYLLKIKDIYKEVFNMPEIGKPIFNKEVIIYNVKQQERNCLLSCYLVKEPESCYYEGSLMDISLQKQMAVEVAHYNEMLRKTQRLAKIAFFDYAADTDTVFWSDEIEVLLGAIPSGENILRGLLAYIHPEDQGFVKGTYEKSLENMREDVKLDYRIIDEKGQIKYVHSRFSNIFKNNAYTGTTGWVQDVSRIRQAQEELLKSNLMRDSILNTIPVAVYWKDKDLKYVGSNNAFLEDAGIAYPKDLIGKTDLDMPWHKQARELMMEDDLFLLETGEAQIGFEGPLKKADGETAWIKASKVPMRNSSGEIEGILGVYEDITAWKKTQNELLRAYEKVEESDRVKTSFLANISHQIRTPLSAIVGFSDMLAKGDIDTAEIEYFTRLIQNQADHLLKVVSDVLDISLIESNQLKIETESVDILSILHDQYSVVQNQLRSLNNDHIRVLLSVPKAETLFVRGDRVRIRQVLSNLVDNAIKFTQFGFIEIGCQVDNDKNILLFVKDSGVGIDEKCRKVIFNRFRQGDESFAKQFPGLGLGLSIAKELVGNMNGEIWVESEPEMGSAFYFTLPIIDADIAGRTNKVELPGEVDEQNWKNKTILLSDDVKHLHQLVNMLVREKGIKVISALNGEEAIALAEKNPHIDLVLMDIQMPGIDGIQAMKRLKKMYNDMPVVAFTAYAMAGDKERYLEMGFDEYLSKPIDQGEFWQLLHKFLKTERFVD